MVHGRIYVRHIEARRDNTGNIWYSLQVTSLPDFSGNFWAGVGLAAAVATALATGISTFLAAWWRWRDRAEAEWSITVERSGGIDSYGDRTTDPELMIRVVNVGDGTAYKVKTSGRHLEDTPSFLQRRRDGHGWTSIASPLPSLRTGESVLVRAKCADADLWTAADFRISWWHSPTRRKRKWLLTRSAQLHESVALADLAENPART